MFNGTPGEVAAIVLIALASGLAMGFYLGWWLKGVAQKAAD